MRKRSLLINDKMQKGYRYQLTARPGLDFDPEFTPRRDTAGRCCGSACSAEKYDGYVGERRRQPALKMRPPRGPHRCAVRSGTQALLLQLGPMMFPVLVTVDGTGVRALPVLPSASVRWGHCETRHQREASNKCSKPLGVERHLTPPDCLKHSTRSRKGPEGPSPA
jgi:hypothetical protein